MRGRSRDDNELDESHDHHHLPNECEDNVHYYQSISQNH